MEEGPPPFTFPPRVPRDVAERLLGEAYRELNDGKILRRALQRQRDAGFDPPGDVQYVSEPRLEPYADGLGVSLSSDILLYEQFDGMDACVDIFEAVLGEALLERLDKKVRKWLRANPA